ncbi:SymE family type I addiction module toxin [Parapedobacter deserti]|uniref:SymE family type I addiction module toxin n=1 Tax=Parapedobacter deserti TaxID=1912957 RepID=A0ABV7JEA7_9SPHI
MVLRQVCRILKFLLLAKKNNKQVKVQAKYRPSQSRCVGATGKDVPWLNLSGVWLSEAGFNIGDTVRVVWRSGLLLIERIEFSEEEKEQVEYKAALQEVKQTLKKLAQ